MSYAKLELNGKTAVVIGGTSGIGLAIAKGLAEAGANVIPTGRRVALVEAAANEMRNRGSKSSAVPCDVSDDTTIEALLDAAVKEFGGVQILVNSAGSTKRSATLDVSLADWNHIFDINLTGTFRACQIFGRHMIERKYGRIINIASLGAVLGLYEVAAYCASKAGVAALTKSLAIEWARFGVCVNAIIPGVFHTEMNAGMLKGTPRGEEFLIRTPMRRFGELEELAGAAVFLASDAASFVTGHLLAVDGGILASGVNQ
jgi:NAD(P)-dependent dehydrogenase (short-subunit alcohol dehydrogenase family)